MKDKIFAISIFAAVYTIVSTVIWGMFFFRREEIGAGVSVPLGGSILDFLVIAIFVYATTKENEQMRIFGSIMFSCLVMIFVFILKDQLLYPLIVRILGM